MKAIEEKRPGDNLVFKFMVGDTRFELVTPTVSR